VEIREGYGPHWQIGMFAMRAAQADRLQWSAPRRVQGEAEVLLAPGCRLFHVKHSNQGGGRGGCKSGTLENSVACLTIRFSGRGWNRRSGSPGVVSISRIYISYLYLVSILQSGVDAGLLFRIHKYRESSRLPFQGKGSEGNRCMRMLITSECYSDDIQLISN